MDKYERLKEIYMEMAQLQRERDIIKHSMQRETQDLWFKLQKIANEEIAKRPPLEVKY